MYFLDFTISNLTLLALILAIGIVVDDAIIVMENAYRHQEGLGKDPVTAAIDGTRLAHDALQTMHNGRPLWVRYDLDAIAAAVDRDDLASRLPSMWRYRELLPADEPNIVTLGEGMTPLLRCKRLGAAMGLNNLWIKDESQLPTGSFKARGLSMAVSKAKELGVHRLAIPTAGNAGGALAAYAARAGLEAWVFMPDDTPSVNQLEARNHGARAPAP